jgi:hypothetical protein
MALLYKYKDGKKLTGNLEKDFAGTQKEEKQKSLLEVKKVNLFPTGVAPYQGGKAYSYGFSMPGGTATGLGYNVNDKLNLNLHTMESGVEKDPDQPWQLPLYKQNIFIPSASYKLPGNSGSIGLNKLAFLNEGAPNSFYNFSLPDTSVVYSNNFNKKINDNLSLGGNGSIAISDKNRMYNGSLNADLVFKKLGLEGSMFVSKRNEDKPSVGVEGKIKYNF